MALAIAALEDQSSPLDDAELAAVDPAPTNLDLPDECIDGRTQSSALSDKLGNFEELPIVDVLDCFVIVPVLWNGLEAPASSWTTLGGLCG